MDLFQNLVWRLAPAALILSLLLSLAGSRFLFATDQDVAGFFREDPAEYGLYTVIDR